MWGWRCGGSLLTGDQSSTHTETACSLSGRVLIYLFTSCQCLSFSPYLLIYTRLIIFTGFCVAKIRIKSQDVFVVYIEDLRMKCFLPVRLYSVWLGTSGFIFAWRCVFINGVLGLCGGQRSGCKHKKHLRTKLCEFCDKRVLCYFIAKQQNQWLSQFFSNITAFPAEYFL